MQGAYVQGGFTSEGVLHRVLVITHDHALAGALEEALAVWGFEAVHAENEADALEACARRHPSAVLVEQLRDASTAAVSHALRDTFGADLPPLVIVGSEDASAPPDTSAIELQVPFVLDDLRIALERACADGRRLLH
jgi:DNA-binding NtrC family response regulator